MRLLSLLLYFYCLSLGGGLSFFIMDLAPFLSAINTGNHNLPVWRPIFSAITASQTALPVLLIARIVGIFYGLWKRKYFLLAWCILPYFVEPRSAPSVAFYPFCMLMAYAITDTFPAFVDYVRKVDPFSQKLEFNQRGWINISLLLIMVYLFVETSLYGFRLINTSLSVSDREAMAWIKKKHAR